ncbi:receptor-like protein kinase HSL1 [Lycium barbarum]|uniref:receptor-like protein kinase HSL1 n=1 Tax=Lycium barbarum TaxID=112863 RepID=UPI00293E48EA|nr:receptor-like protein kinase HSL1 [Lycium barbarum]
MKINNIRVVKSIFSIPRKQVCLSIVFLLAFLHFQAGLQSYENEKRIMLELKQLWGFQSWNSNSSYCNWDAVSCINGSVTGIRIVGGQLTRIPPIICRLKSLQWIILKGNNIIGEFPTYLYNCSKLEYLDLSSNQFDGPLPSDLHRLSGLIHLDISENSFSEIPGAIGQLSELQYLSLRFNLFNNSIPREIGNLTKLETLDISYIERFKQATIPEELGRLKKLKHLMIVRSNLIGEIPDTFSALSGLQTLDLSANLLNGSIPSYLFHWKNLTSLQLEGNQFSGRLPMLAANVQLMGKTQQTFSSLSGLEVIDLSYNHLNGSIPSYLFLFKKLNTLYLHDNKFSGSLPRIAGNLRLRTLDLSSNQLSGYIPQEYDNKDYLFSNNLNLCTEYTNYYNQVRLCSGKRRVILPIVVPVALLVIVTLLYYRVKKNWKFSIDQFMWRKKRHENQDPEWMFISFQRLEFTESEILVNMTEENLIGSGGSGKVYRVGVNPNGNFLAVKRIWNKRNLDHRLEQQFLAEVEVLGSIRHSNIVKLLCCISSGNSKVLVYEYMENQSLDKWLHNKRRSEKAITASAHCVLEWRTRLQIAVGAARGLCYMHHECTPPIIHRDIKCSNILLDHELNAKIADFGLAKVSAKWGEMETASAIAGTFGYLAPEYAYTSKVSVKSDVYSFGVVLLELVTGREPINRDEHINLAQWAWKHHEEGNPIINAIDEEIKEACFLKEMSSMFKLGLICTSSLPSARPSMKEVLQILLLSVTC